MLALSTLCAPDGLALHEAVASFHELGVRAVALHRAPTAAEAGALSNVAGSVRIVAIFCDEVVWGDPLHVVEGGPASDDREASLDALCRRLHAFKGYRVALRTPQGDGHPAPGEIELVAETLPFCRYFHDCGRGGVEYLDAAGKWLAGASFHPLEHDLRGVRDALSAAAPAVISCPPEQTAEALRCAQGVFRA